MSDDLSRKLHSLHESRALNVIDHAAYERGLSKLRADYGHAAVNALLPQFAPAGGAAGQQRKSKNPWSIALIIIGFIILSIILVILIVVGFTAATIVLMPTVENVFVTVTPVR